jgi:hypothetical protein
MKVVRPERGARDFLAWWIKCDPTAPGHHGWNWPDLFLQYRRSEAYLWSVGTALSQKNARLARRGDPVVGYSAGEGYRVVAALAEVERGAVFVPGARPPSLTSGLPGGFTVALRPVALLETPLTLARARTLLAPFESEFFRTRFGSIFKMREAELRALLGEVRRTNPGVRVPPRWPGPRAAVSPRRPSRGT